MNYHVTKNAVEKKNIHNINKKCDNRSYKEDKDYYFKK